MQGFLHSSAQPRARLRFCVDLSGLVVGRRAEDGTCGCGLSMVTERWRAVECSDLYCGRHTPYTIGGRQPFALAFCYRLDRHLRSKARSNAPSVGGSRALRQPMGRQTSDAIRGKAVYSDGQTSSLHIRKGRPAQLPPAVEY